MCGIFGFALSKPLKVSLALRVLALLERHKYSNEKHSVGGHGAGTYFTDTKGKGIFLKVGKTDGSPAKLLARKILETKPKAKLLISHVRWASPDFMDTISFKECTQPYVAACGKGLKVVTVHNGFVENYKELRARLQLRHGFESEKAGGLIDSEVIPHFLEEKLCSGVDVAKALGMLSVELTNQRGNTVGVLLLGKEKRGNHLAFVHHGKTRGLTVWSNPNEEVVFASRKAPVNQIIGEFLKKHGFKEKISIAWKEQKHVNSVVFPLPINVFDT